MKQFTMSMYSSKEELYKAKSTYYQDLVYAMAMRLEDIGEIAQDGGGEWFWANTGELLVEDVEK
jgi:hypothetical protein